MSTIRPLRLLWAIYSVQFVMGSTGTGILWNMLEKKTLGFSIGSLSGIISLRKNVKGHPM